MLITMSTISSWAAIVWPPQTQQRPIPLAKRDYYEILGVVRNVGEGELKSAYRKLALEHHPDRNPGDPEAEDKFKEASEAYAILSNAEKRQRYDRFGHDGVGAGGGPGGFDFGDLGNFGDIFNDLFGDIFGAGAGRSRGRGQRGADLRYNLEIELHDVLEGLDARIKIPKTHACETCEGSALRARPSLPSAISNTIEFGRRSRRFVASAFGISTERLVALAWIGQPNPPQVPPYTQAGRLP